jgi:hypothetical protein
LDLIPRLISRSVPESQSIWYTLRDDSSLLQPGSIGRKVPRAKSALRDDSAFLIAQPRIFTDFP